MTETEIVVTKQQRSALNSQPLPKPASEANGPVARAREGQRRNLSDADIAARWLNAAKDAKASVPYDRIRRIRDELRQLREAHLALLAMGPDPEELARVEREHEKKLELMKAELRATGKATEFTTAFPGNRINDDALHADLNRKVNELSGSLNEQLHRYAFRPQVAYARLPGTTYALQNLWAGAMVPDPDAEGFDININGRPVSEADAALALVNLDLAGDLNRVDLCKECGERWMVIAHKNYKFCSRQCRKADNAKQPGYHGRKARNQKNHRMNVKKRRANQLLARLEREEI